MLRGRFCSRERRLVCFCLVDLLLFVYMALDIRKEVGKKRYGDMFGGEKVGHSVSFWGGITCKQAF